MASIYYSYSTDHKPVPLNRPLWKIRNNRPSEWQEIVRVLEESPKDLFQSLLRVPEIKSHLHNFQNDPGIESYLLFITKYLIDGLGNLDEILKYIQY